MCSEKVEELRNGAADAQHQANQMALMGVANAQQKAGEMTIKNVEEVTARSQEGHRLDGRGIQETH